MKERMMRTCGYYDEDGDDVGLGRAPCARDPYSCRYFRPNRYYCPFMKFSGGYNQKRIAEWREWKSDQIAQRKFDRSTSGRLIKTVFSLNFWLGQGICITIFFLILIGWFVFNWLKSVI
jgi:hypothetical protein